MTKDKANRILDAFEAVRSGIYPSHATEQTEQDVGRIRDRYNALKWELPFFSEAMRQAQVEFMLMVCQERETA